MRKENYQITFFNISPLFWVGISTLSKTGCWDVLTSLVSPSSLDIFTAQLIQKIPIKSSLFFAFFTFFNYN